MTNNSKVVNIIIPVYNTASYLDRCMDSIINQTYNNLNVVFIDDGSSDESGVICDSYAEKYENVHVIHLSNGGVSRARNSGLDFVSPLWGGRDTFCS